MHIYLDARQDERQAQPLPWPGDAIGSPGMRHVMRALHQGDGGSLLVFFTGFALSMTVPVVAIAVQTLPLDSFAPDFQWIVPMLSTATLWRAPHRRCQLAASPAHARPQRWRRWLLSIGGMGLARTVANPDAPGSALFPLPTAFMAWDVGHPRAPSLPWAWAEEEGRAPAASAALEVIC